MTPSLLSALLAFAFVASITPGPNNLMLMASGANFGLRRSLPHLAGVSLGFCLMVMLVGWTFAGMIALVPGLYGVLRWVGAAYLLYLAFKIATAAGLGAAAAGARPFSFLRAAAFQWVNPKGWAMALGGVATYAPRDHLFVNVAIVATLFALVGLPCTLGWAAFGMGLKRYLSSPIHLRVFNGVMAVLLVASLYPLLTEPLA